MSPTFLKHLSPMVKNFAVSLIPEMDPAHVLKAWEKLRKVPGGKIIFSEILGKFVPYTGSISPKIMELEPGTALVILNDHMAVRNHLKSVHAMALANLGECASGLALLAKVPATHHAILVGFEVDYLKKARGTLTARGSVVEWEEMTSDSEQIAVSRAEIRNTQQDVVALCLAQWKVSPKNAVKKADASSSTRKPRGAAKKNRKSKRM